MHITQVRLPRPLAAALASQARVHERAVNSEHLLAVGLYVALGTAAKALEDLDAEGAAAAHGQALAESDMIYNAAFGQGAAGYAPNAIVRELIARVPRIGVEVGSPFPRPSY